MKSSIVKLYRYLRPIDLDLSRFELVTRPTGGITFLFEIDQDKGELTYVPVICRDDENFNFQISKNIADGRFAKKLYTTIIYDRSVSLIRNVVNFLDLGKSRTGPSATLKSKLREIMINNADAQLMHRNIISQVNAKHMDILHGFNPPTAADYAALNHDLEDHGC